MQRSSPLVSAGLMRFEASMTPPEAAPAPITVWISSMNRIAPGCFLSSPITALEALLEIAAVLGAGNQRAQIERVQGAVAEHVGHLALDDQARQALGDGRLAHARLADVERIILAAPAQDLDRALDLDRAPDQRIDAPGLRLRIEIGGVLLKRARALAVALAFAGRRFVGLGLGIGAARQAVGNEMHHVQARDVLAAEQEHRVALLFTEYRHQHVDHADFLAAAGLHVEHRALQDALKTERRLHFALFALAHQRGVGLDMGAQLAGQLVGCGPAAAEHFAHLRRIEQRQQQLLDGQEFVAARTRLAERLVETEFKFAGQHVR